MKCVDDKRRDVEFQLLFGVAFLLFQREKYSIIFSVWFEKRKIYTKHKFVIAGAGGGARDTQLTELEIRNSFLKLISDEEIRKMEFESYFFKGLFPPLFPHLLARE